MESRTRAREPQGQGIREVRIAVTGGGGFIGKAVTLAGEAMGHQMYAFDRTDGNDVLGRLGALTDFAPKSVIHLAGILGTHELFDTAETAVEINIIGTLRILEWCRNSGASYVGVTMPPVFPSVYTATKVCTDRLATAWHREFGIPVAKVRAFNAFGPGQKFGAGHPQKIVPAFAVTSWRRQRLPIWGDGRQTVDLIDVMQIAQIMIEATQFSDDVTIDAGSGQSMSVNEVAAFINDVTGSIIPNEYLPMRRGEEPTHIAATGEGWDRLSFRPSLNMDALVQTVHSYHMIAQEMM